MLKILTLFVQTLLVLSRGKTPEQNRTAVGNVFCQRELEGYYPCTYNLITVVYNLGKVCCPPMSVCVWDGLYINEFDQQLNGCVQDFEYIDLHKYTICPAETQWEYPTENDLQPGCVNNHCNSLGECCDQYNSNACTCPHQRFLDCHVCEWCRTEEDFETFTKITRIYPNKFRCGVLGQTNTVFVPWVPFDVSTRIGRDIERGKPVDSCFMRIFHTWICKRNPEEPEDFDCSFLPTGTNIETSHDPLTGHFRGPRFQTSEED